ncbi:His-Xaa-Ser system radical SAM maturase HxsC [Novosphingobium fuchskuhlense]|uniref:His-Xaa-Ser system radical SAM maturase HxsC n=1 Tax=Novosphingobium fuchskuhlense TaxID=1117702 RepID=A0A117UUB1_9SPHN|nr:His-Xaa-Ser system radical SAM maturase HxsC [Novosphingobium fuchskuhlense]KUR71001.1 His-Xaa-Ser system radical SAM maturase HxsC [Novosphingobium fuchskuhlense]
MIPLMRPALADAEGPYVTRLRTSRIGTASDDAILIEGADDGSVFSGRLGLVVIDGVRAEDLDGDIVLVDPRRGRVERLLRVGSTTNTLLVTERCDQLCVMCSQPPKKTHVDRFDLLEEACRLAPDGMLIGISGGEPTLYKERLLTLIERTLAARPDLGFHVLTNAQHFEASDVARLGRSAYRRVSWGIPLYASEAALHDNIVGKEGAFAKLEEGLAHLAMAGARVELRTVVLSDNIDAFPALAGYVAARLRFVEAWSIMQLEHIGFARNRWEQLFFDHVQRFGPIAEALNRALLHGVRAQLFNFPRCTVPAAYRRLAIASISDWKRKFAPACLRCGERSACSGFFEWHPDEQAALAVQPL